MQREVPCSGAQQADAPAGYWTRELTKILFPSLALYQLAAARDKLDRVITQLTDLFWVVAMVVALSSLLVMIRII